MFNKNTFHFLAELANNNDRDWFKSNQPQYEQLVRAPALQFIEQMQPSIEQFSQRFVAVPKKVGGSLMRPQRDARFSKDKTPYKTNIGIQFRHFQGKDVHAPGLYLHIANDNCFIGAGIWRPESAVLAKIRSCLDDNPRAYQKALETMQQNGFELSGASLIRPPKGYDKDHPMIAELKRKDFIAIKSISKQQVCSQDFLEFCTEQYQHTRQFMAYLCFALQLDF
ncbi:DUF2461 domain-containing protein [Paraferrimonas sp. SM1919]|uniref:DUF2461 domain-containing protein n=1 Tax=Paraferrimonas sp. SM1919 TaxID=2662263 RepID=UPI0013D596A4|nr:DUF2461 domain-containing protein [Paraferrimonas sp. SM1919]